MPLIVQPRLTRRALLGTFVAAVPLMAACAPSAGSLAPSTQPTSAAPAPGPTLVAPAAGRSTSGNNTVVFGSFADARMLNPILATDGPSESVWELIFEALVKADPNSGLPIPALAQS